MRDKWMEVDKKSVLDRMDRIELYMTEERMACVGLWGNVDDYLEWEGWLWGAMVVRELGKQIKGETK